MGRQRKGLQLSPAEASFILEALLTDRRIDSKTVAEYRTRFQEEISSLEARLAHLRRLTAPLTPAIVGAAIVAAAPAITRAAKRVAPKVANSAKRVARQVSMTVSPERRKIRALQGKYLGFMHKIPKAVMKQRFGKDAIRQKGKEAVVAEMERYVSGQTKPR